jgi:SAM-dependent methyltransferase
MNWKLKAHLLALVSRTPGGKAIYHRAQSWAGTNRLGPAEGLARAAEIVEMVREAGRDPCRGTYLEVGTGWRPYLPFLLYLVGAERVMTLDVNPWLTEAYAFETYWGLEGQIESVAQRLGLDAGVLRERYQAAASAGRDLERLLKACRIEYRCPADARGTGLEGGSVDFVCSSNVLEHIPPDVLRDIHRESHRVLRPGGLAVHRFNPQDHFSTVDRSITGVNFLRYSERAWHWYGGSGLSYHNRLRCVQHRKLMEEAGLAVVTDRARIDRRALAAIQNNQAPIHPDFAAYTPEELAADYMWVVAQRAPTSSASRSGSAEPARC